MGDVLACFLSCTVGNGGQEQKRSRNPGALVSAS